MKSLADLQAIRAKTLENINMHSIFGGVLI